MSGKEKATVAGFLKRLLGRKDKSESCKDVDAKTLKASKLAVSSGHVQSISSGLFDAPKRDATPALSRNGPTLSDTPTKGVRHTQGSLIGGRYEVQKILGGPGKSGMGVVYVAYDRWDKKLRAIKSFQDQEIWDREIVRVFRREAELWIGLGHHPHIVAAHTLRKPDGRLYLVLEYIEPDTQGRNTLTQHLAGQPPPLEQTVRWAIQFCWGMEYAA